MVLGLVRSLVDFAIEDEFGRWEKVLDYLSGWVNVVWVVVLLVVSLFFVWVVGEIVKLVHAVHLDE